MRIGIVGGILRNETVFREIAERLGYDLAFHSGYIGGRGSETLRKLGLNVDLLIVQTDVNSHGAVHLARQTARRSGVPIMIYRRLSPNRFAAIAAGFATSDMAKGGGNS
jgi:hypothetical protein